jgi:TRAP-type mannitol/chloroaromatic compound transport system permease small subunit
MTFWLHYGGHCRNYPGIIMQKMLSKIVQIIESITKWSGYLLAGLVVVMTLIVGYEVVVRYFFNKPTNWAMELTTMIFGTFMLGAGAWTLLKDGHVRMDIFYNRWSKRGKALADAATFPLITFFLAVILWKSAIFSLESIRELEHSHSAWGPPIYYWKATLPIAVMLMILMGFSKFIRNLYFLVTGREL